MESFGIPFAICRLIDPLGTDDFRLHHYDALQFGYRRPPPVEVSDNEDNDDDANDSNCDRNDNRDTTVGQRIQVQLGQIQSGTAVSELNLCQFRLLLIENFNARFHENTLKWPTRLARDLPRNVPSN